MKHIMMSENWEYGVDPFPAFRCNLVYGRNQRSRAFLPVKEVVPVVHTTYTTRKNFGGTLYEGSDKTAAELAKVEYDEKNKAETAEGVSWYPTTATISEKSTLPTLPEDKFRVIKTKEKDTILVVSGEDNTNRCLLFVGISGGFRGGEDVVSEGTTGNILKKCSAGNACQSRTEAIVLLEVGQTIAFRTYGRRTNEVYQYLWNGAEVEEKHFSYAEWKTRHEVASPADDDAEVL